jgi:hypothetical protein
MWGKVSGAVIERSLASLCALAICALFLTSGPARAATTQATVSAGVVKPLTLGAERDFTLGSISVRGGTWSGAVVSLSRGGVLSCTNPNTICSGVVQTALYRTTGTNNRVVMISAPPVTMVNQTDPTRKLTLTPDAPASVLLTSSGLPGIVFPVGGSITLNSNVADGLYTGTFNVTVDYQ